MDPEIYKAANKARVALTHGEKSLIIVKDGKQMHYSTARGIAPLLDLVENDIEKLHDAIVGDRIVGRAAAFLCIFAKVKAVFAMSMAYEALDLLEKHTIQPTWSEMVPYIVERDMTSRSKLDLHLKDVEDPATAVAMIREFVNSSGTAEEQTP